MQSIRSRNRAKSFVRLPALSRNAAVATTRVGIKMSKALGMGQWIEYGRNCSDAAHRTFP